MENDRYTDLLRQTREEIARRGTQELEQERNRRQRSWARNAANSGIRGAYGVMAFENGAEIQERNRANRYISEYRDLQNAYGQSGAEADESILQQMKQLGGKMRIANSPVQVKKVFAAAGIQKMIGMEDVT